MREHEKKTPTLSGWLRAFRPRLSESVVAVNNAGGAHGLDRVGDIQDSDIDAMFSTNVLGLIFLTQLLIKGLPAAYITSLHLTVSPHPKNAHTVTVLLQHG